MYHWPEVDYFLECCDSNYMLNVNRTKYMATYFQKSSYQMFPILIKSTPVKSVNCCKYLGTDLDKKQL